MWHKIAAVPSCTPTPFSYCPPGLCTNLHLRTCHQIKLLDPVWTDRSACKRRDKCCQMCMCLCAYCNPAGRCEAEFWQQFQRLTKVQNSAGIVPLGQRYVNPLASSYTCYLLRPTPRAKKKRWWNNVFFLNDKNKKKFKKRVETENLKSTPEGFQECTFFITSESIKSVLAGCHLTGHGPELMFVSRAGVVQHIW